MRYKHSSFGGEVSQVWLVEPGLNDVCPLVSICLANCRVCGLAEICKYRIIASDFQRPSSWMEFVSTLAQSRAVAPPARRERVSISWGWMPSVSGPIWFRLWRSMLRMSVDETWLVTEFWKNVHRGVDGGWLWRNKYRTLRMIAMQGHTRVSPLRLWDIVSPLTPFFWLGKHKATAVIVLRSARVLTRG
jgi:hypothetical protein